jgi:hypothetical protein
VCRLQVRFLVTVILSYTWLTRPEDGTRVPKHVVLDSNSVALTGM